MNNNVELKNISKKYRPIPFWSWNEKLQTEETVEQIQKMDEAGIGGFFIHARGGLQTPYMGEEWFENVTAAVEECEKRGMRPWVYDENGWPSGSGNGIVNELGVTYQQKFLCMESEKQHQETAICKCGEHYFYYDVNPFYVDVLDKRVIRKFIESVYEPYYARYGNRIEGFFTDEPQISRTIPWSFVFEEEYAKKYQENILDKLEQLFLPLGEYKTTRVKFWKMVTDLFSESYMKQIYDWCDERGLKWTGHLVQEDHLRKQVPSNGVCMPHYEYMHIPGMDCLGRSVEDIITPIQVSSVAEQLGKEAVLSETFALCGHNVSFAELKGIYEWQMVHGINLLCQHLEGYSIRGIRKRDYPPAMYVQQPWWEDYFRFNDAMSRVGSVLCQGERKVDILVLEPQTTVWSLFDADKSKGVEELHEGLVSVIQALERKHLEFHLGDETILERHGKVENGKLIVGKQSYSQILLPGCERLLETTKILLKEFCESGGKIVTTEEIQENPVIHNPEITYTSRVFEGFIVHYFVNTSPEFKKAEVVVQGRKLDIYSGALEDFSGVHEFEPWGSLMLFEKNGEAAVSETIIRQDGALRIVSSTLNSITLDYCDYYFNDVLQEKNGYVLNIAERANEREEVVDILQDYHVELAYIPEKLYLACETPERFEIKINGTMVDGTPSGYFCDKSIQKIDISKYMMLGKNTISFRCFYKQRDGFYEERKQAKISANVKNKLVYDMEIEPIYLLGDFSVRTDGQWVGLERMGMRYKGTFIIDYPKTRVTPKHLEQQGYPFFAGTIVLEGEIDVKGDYPVLQAEVRGINVLKVEVNGIEKVLLTDKKVPLADFQVSGKVKIKYTLTNNLRNLLGPHHLEIGESYRVGPGDFYKEPCIWTKGTEWNDAYCFVEMSI